MGPYHNCVSLGRLFDKLSLLGKGDALLSSSLSTHISYPKSMVTGWEVHVHVLILIQSYINVYGVGLFII